MDSRPNNSPPQSEEKMRTLFLLLLFHTSPCDVLSFVLPWEYKHDVHQAIPFDPLPVGMRDDCVIVCANEDELCAGE